MTTPECHCGNKTLIFVTGKTSDMCSISVPDLQYEKSGYVPKWLGPNGYGDYIEIIICSECGQLQDWKPVRDFPE